MKLKLDIDTDKLKSLAADFKKQGAGERLRSDPRGELAKLGIHIDDELEGKLKNRLSSATPTAASAVHIDV